MVLGNSQQNVFQLNKLDQIVRLLRKVFQKNITGGKNGRNNFKADDKYIKKALDLNYINHFAIYNYRLVIN